MIEMIISAFIVGFMVAIPPGMVTVVAAQKTVLYGLKSSLFFTAGSCLSDIFYILLVFFGMAPLLNNSVLFKIIFWFFSSALLFYFGFDTFRSSKKTIVFSNQPLAKNRLMKDILSGVGITLTNPMTIAGWLVIAGGFFTHWREQWPSIHQYGWLSILVIMIGVLCWFIPLLFIIDKAKNILNTVILRALVILSGIFFVAIGFYSIYSTIYLILI